MIDVNEWAEIRRLHWGRRTTPARLHDELRRLGRTPLIVIDPCRPRDYPEEC